MPVPLPFQQNSNKQLYEFASTTVRQYHRRDGVNNRNLFSHSFGGYKSKIKMLAGSLFSEASLAYRWLPSLLVFSLCLPLCPDISQFELLLTPMASFNLSYLFKDIFSKLQSHSVALGFRTSAYVFDRDISHHKTPPRNSVLADKLLYSYSLDSSQGI